MALFVNFKLYHDFWGWAGHVQLITGDFFQLPPVSKSGSKGFAFEAASWNTCIDSTFVLKHVFRQKNREFVRWMNR